MSETTATDIDKILPQTQCRECGYDGCMPYAKAMIEENAAINLCPPGGSSTLKKLAALTGQSADPYFDEMNAKTRKPEIAVIDEAQCIGCTKCITACPVDAIIGAGKKMHTILQQECTGCGLCVPPCPVDCIDIKEIPAFTFMKEKSRIRYQVKNARAEKARTEKALRHAKAVKLKKTNDQKDERMAKQAYIQEARARVQAKKQGGSQK